MIPVALTSCQMGFKKEELNTREQNFVNCYNEYIKPTLESADTVEITYISETRDKNGGTIVRFSYEYVTKNGYKSTASMSIVTSTITIDSSLITLSEYSESYYGEKVVKYNGKSVKAGYILEKNSWSSNQNENEEIISLWGSVQANYKYSKNNIYDLDLINEYIK